MRRGVAATELAFCLPLIVMLVLASLEACSMISLNHSLSIASYEGVPSQSTSTRRPRRWKTGANRLSTRRNVSGGLVEIEPADVATVPSGEQISVTISARCDAKRADPALVLRRPNLVGHDHHGQRIVRVILLFSVNRRKQREQRSFCGSA